MCIRYIAKTKQYNIRMNQKKQHKLPCFQTISLCSPRIHGIMRNQYFICKLKYNKILPKENYNAQPTSNLYALHHGC